MAKKITIEEFDQAIEDEMDKMLKAKAEGGFSGKLDKLLGKQDLQRSLKERTSQP